MLDNRDKTHELMTALEAALPFEVELTPDLIARLRTQQPPVLVAPQQIVSQISYAGDEGGVVCHILNEETKNAVIVSMTHVRMHRKNPLAAAVLAYQKHRMKKLKKQRGE